ncbi:MAG: putative 2-oxoglutarate dehydrogenase component, partial [Actinomycetota bacterium]
MTASDWGYPGVQFQVMSETLNPAVNSSPDFGANSWLVEEMYEQFRQDPQSVGDSWQEFFSDYKSLTADNPAVQAPERVVPSVPPNGVTAPTVAPVAPKVVVPPAASAEVGEPIRGAGAAIVSNMERSLSVPTATSFRNVPAKLLEVNRSVINGYRSRTGQSKISFTHII